jgi:hypothetical protein
MFSFNASKKFIFSIGKSLDIRSKQFFSVFISAKQALTAKKDKFNLIAQLKLLIWSIPFTISFLQHKIQRSFLIEFSQHFPVTHQMVGMG